MSRPDSGRYILCSRLTNSQGAKLAATFHGYKRAVSIEPLTRARNQIWNLSHFREDSDYYVLMPDSNHKLQCALGFNGPEEQYVDIQPLDGAVLWIVKRSYSDDYTIQVGSEKWYWSTVYAGSVGEEDIALTPNDLGMGSHWSLERVR